MGKEEESQLRGLSKYFNSVTVTGRANVAKATYASVAALIIWACCKPKKIPPPAPEGKCY